MLSSQSMKARGALALFPDLLTAAVAAGVWCVFYPGLLSFDSVAQIGQALRGQYSDWHPPLMSVLIGLVLRAGAPVSLLLLGQCLAGAFGVRALVSACLRRLRPQMSPELAAWLSLLAFLLLLVPYSPLSFYLMTLWKDAWAAVILLWLGAFSLSGDPEAGSEDRRWAWSALAVLVLAVALGSIRHNAIVTLPAAGLVLWLKTGPRVGRARALALAMAPLLLWLAVEPLVDRVFRVEQQHPDAQIIALDLVGLCAQGPEICRQLPYTRRHLRAPAAAFYRPGDVGPLLGQTPRLVDPALFADYPALKAEFLRAVVEHPRVLAHVKVEAFVPLLGIRQTSYFVHTTMMDNPYGLTLNHRFAEQRSRLTNEVATVSEDAEQRWISGVHLVWLMANVLWVVGLLIAFRRTRQARLLLLAAVLLVPLGYYLSYLLAAPVHDFRFMYPATLMVQCVTLAGLAALVPQKPRGRAPNLSRLVA